jgi:hypothetical protein
MDQSCLRKTPGLDSARFDPARSHIHISYNVFFFHIQCCHDCLSFPWLIQVCLVVQLFYRNFMMLPQYETKLKGALVEVRRPFITSSHRNTTISTISCLSSLRLQPYQLVRSNIVASMMAPPADRRSKEKTLLRN